MQRRTLLEDFIYAKLDENFVYMKNKTINKGYINHIDVVEIKMTVHSNGIISPQKLIDKYMLRTKSTLAMVKQLTGVDVSGLKRNCKFPKEKICLLTICLDLSYRESKDLLLACSINLDPSHSVYDCVYETYIQHQNRQIDVRKRIDDYNKYQREADIYVKNKRR